MTPRERAEQSMSFQMGDTIYHMKGRLREAQIDAIEQAITAAVEEEREACRKVAAGWARLYDPFSDPRCTVAINIAEAIAARNKSDGGTK